MRSFSFSLLLALPMILAAQTAVPATAPKAAPTAPAPTSPAPTAPTLPPGSGQSIVATTCGQCHGLDTVTSVRKNKADWQTTVEAMNDKGAGLSDSDVSTVVDYLAANFGPTGSSATSPASAPASAPDPLPAGSGKDLVASTCVGCHTLDRVVSRQMSRAGWQGTVDDMISRGADLTPEEEATVVDYLVAHFGKPAEAGQAAIKR